jgi:hypothetical protein
MLYICRYDVQSLVERPFLHIVGRSTSSVADQLLYVEERVDDILQATVPIDFEGRQYHDKIRFNSGSLLTFIEQSC